MNISLPLFSAEFFSSTRRFILFILARNFGSSARLLSFPTPESYSCTSRIRESQVKKQLTKITAKNLLDFCPKFGIIQTAIEMAVSAENRTSQASRPNLIIN